MRVPLVLAEKIVGVAGDATPVSVARQCWPRAGDDSALAKTPAPFCRTAVSNASERTGSIVYDARATSERVMPRSGAMAPSTGSSPASSYS